MIAWPPVPLLVSGHYPANVLYVLIQVLAGPSVIVRPAGKLAHQL